MTGRARTRKLGPDGFAAAVRFFERDRAACFACAGDLADAARAGRPEGWVVSCDAAPTPTTMVAVHGPTRRAFLASADPESDGFEAVSDELAGVAGRLTLSGEEAAVTQHLVLNPGLRARVVRRTTQRALRLTPDGLKLKPPGITRPARGDDVPALRRWDRSAAAERRAPAARDLERAIADGMLFVADIDRMVQGVVCVGRPAYEAIALTDLFVFAEFRGRGVGRGLIADLCERLFLAVGLDAAAAVDDDDEAAAGVFAKVGFEPAGREATVYFEG